MNTADRLFINGCIYTMDRENRLVEALAIKGDRIHALGDTLDILKLKESKTQVIDLKGRAVIPGLIDSHLHIFWTGVSELYGELFIPKSIKELLEYVENRTEEIPKGQWIHLKNVYPTRLEEYRYPTVEELDSVSPNHPVFVDGAYAGRANTYAMNVAGIDETTPSSVAIGKIKANIIERELTLEDHKRAVENIQREYNRFGITSVIDGISSEIGVEAVNRLYENGNLNVRIVFTKVVSSSISASDELKKFEKSIELPREWGKLAFMKVLLDGGILTGTSYMRRPYIDNIGIFDMDQGFRGIINHDAKSIEEFVDVAFREGYQMGVHCIGDGALDVLLEAYESYQQTEDIRDRRFSIIHGDFTDDDSLKTIGELGLVLLFQPAWHFKDAAILRQVLDQETFNNFLPYRKYIDAGILAAAGSDHMVKYDPLLSQNPYHPFWGLYNMVTCNTMEHGPIGEDYRISREDALRFYTEGAAYASFDEGIKGSLEAGKLADFAVLSEDYFNCPLENIPNIESIHTVVGGKTVYSS